MLRRSSSQLTLPSKQVAGLALLQLKMLKLEGVHVVSRLVQEEVRKHRRGSPKQSYGMRRAVLSGIVLMRNPPLGSPF